MSFEMIATSEFELQHLLYVMTTDHTHIVIVAFFKIIFIYYSKNIIIVETKMKILKCKQIYIKNK